MYLDTLKGWLRCPSCAFMKKEKTSMIVRNEILMGRDEEFPLTPELETNLTALLEATNKLRTLYGKPMYVSSGYRPGHFNTDAGGAPGSSHETCQAVDFHDADNELKNWITVEILEECGLWQEAPASTPTWLHVQVRPIPSGHRVFNP
jgi:hypothetical protein